MNFSAKGQLWGGEFHQLPRFHVQVPFLKFHPRQENIPTTTTSELINTQFEDYVMCMVGILKEVSADRRMDGQTYFRYTF